MCAITEETPYPLRAHHGMCLAFFEGKGYDEKFTLHMREIKRLLEQNPKVRLMDSADVICRACPHNKSGQCVSAQDAQTREEREKAEGQTREKAARYDREVLRLCGLRSGQVLDYQSFAEAVKDRILSPGKRRQICGDCQWDSLCGGPSGG